MSFILSVTYAECHYVECRYAECRGAREQTKDPIVNFHLIYVTLPLSYMGFPMLVNISYFHPSLMYPEAVFLVMCDPSMNEL